MQNAGFPAFCLILFHRTIVWMKYKMILAYDGTSFGGWQSQHNSNSIQGSVEQALSTCLRMPVSITGAGRTDAGVHARAQVAHFCLDLPTDLLRLKTSLNGLLPSQIRILSLESVPDEFHARYSAVSKTYHYHLHLDPVPSPFKRCYSWHVKKNLDLDRMRSAAADLIGRHDFTSFTNESRGNEQKNKVRTLHRLDFVEEIGGIRLEFEGDGFLYKMVRNITGTLIEIGTGKLSSIPLILAVLDRKSAGPAAPPQGLFLHRIVY
jgi:tRNA pseudouridine38-40 synthase